LSVKCPSLLRWDGDGERDHVEAAADGFVDRSQARLVITGDDEFERRPVFEKVLTHEASGNHVATG